MDLRCCLLEPYEASRVDISLLLARPCMEILRERGLLVVLGQSNDLLSMADFYTLGVYVFRRKSNMPEMEAIDSVQIGAGNPR